jgi:hypothetical protein
LPLDVTDEDSVNTILSHIDNMMQYGEDEEPKMPKDMDDGKSGASCCTAPADPQVISITSRRPLYASSVCMYSMDNRDQPVHHPEHVTNPPYQS